MILALDTENTIWSEGSPFDQRNFNVCISYATDGGRSGVLFTADGQDRDFLQTLIDEAEVLIGFNFKYDLHWFRKLGYDYTGKRVWCGQTAEFTIGRQAKPYPSLDDTATHYGLGHKLSIIQEEYWSKGINTHEIPRAILAEYAEQDARLTLGVYLAQQKQIQPNQTKLFSLLMQDLLVLQEMEWNGLAFDKDAALQQAEEIERDIAELQRKTDLFHNVPGFNWGSADHLSALLYGGTIVERRRVPVGVYKSGAKVGDTRFRVELVEHHLPRRYNPIRGSAGAKPGRWSVDEKYLTRLKGEGTLIQDILTIKENKKLVSTYLRGLPKKHEEGHMPEGFIHGQLVQCVAATGRLASNSPNLQNISKKATHIFTTRYP